MSKVRPSVAPGREAAGRASRDEQKLTRCPGRYTPSRVYTTSLDLATTDKPLLIPSSDPLRSHSRSIELTVSFDLRLPGWLPSSRLTDLHNTEHGVVVYSAAGWTEAATLAYDPPSIANQAVQTRSIRRTASLLAQLSSVTEKRTSPYFPITIRRHRLPSAMNDRFQDGTERHYSLTPAADSTSPIECVVSVPDWVDVNGGEKDLKVSIRVRARRSAVEKAVRDAKFATAQPAPPALAPVVDSLAAGVTGQTDEAALMPQPLDQPEPPAASVAMERDNSGEILTHILELGMEVDEVETYSSEPSAGFRSLFPIPEQQPSRTSSEHRLVSPAHPRAAQALTQPFSAESKPFNVARRRKCLLADDGSQRNFVFSEDGLGMSERWRKVNIVLPMPHPTRKSSATCRPRGEYDSPMLKVKHSLAIRVVCRNVGNEGEDIVSPAPRVRGPLCRLLTRPRLSSLPRQSALALRPRRCQAETPPALFCPHISNSFTRMAISASATRYPCTRRPSHRLYRQAIAPSCRLCPLPRLHAHPRQTCLQMQWTSTRLHHQMMGIATSRAPALPRLRLCLCRSPCPLSPSPGPSSYPDQPSPPLPRRFVG